MADHPQQARTGPPLHALLDAATMRRMERVRRIGLARGDSAEGVTDDMRAVLLGRHPALPPTMIDSAVATLEAEGRPEPPRHRVVRRFARRLGFRYRTIMRMRTQWSS
jgi:hypothetical protein